MTFTNSKLIKLTEGFSLSLIHKFMNVTQRNLFTVGDTANMHHPQSNAAIITKRCGVQPSLPHTTSFPFTLTPPPEEPGTIEHNGVHNDDLVHIEGVLDSKQQCPVIVAVALVQLNIDTTIGSVAIPASSHLTVRSFVHHTTMHLTP